MGRGANHAVTSYAAGMKPIHVEQLRDALGHHISHYKGALKAHQAATDPKEKAKLRSVADQHLNKIVPLMHLAGKASKHSGGNLTIDYPSTTPWETNYTTTERLPNGKLKEGTKDLGRRPSPNANRAKNPRAVPDYRYLEMPPHPGHASSEKSPHKGGYPFEEIQLGTPGKRDTGQAYLPIEDVKDVKDYVPHPFDAHPVHKHADTPQHELLPEHHEMINSGLAGWADSEHQKKWLSDQKAKHAENPDAYKARGTKKPSHIYDDIKLGEMPHHKDQPRVAPTEASATAPEQITSATPTSVPQRQAEPAKNVTKAQADLDKRRQIWSTLDNEAKKHFKEMKMFPEDEFKV